MTPFEFETDAESEAFSREIAAEMIELFGIEMAEAVRRINHHWKGLRILGKFDIVYHEDAEYWAKTIYYGKEVRWWKGEEGLKPRDIAKRTQPGG